jgi:hypothetical protein
MATIDRRIGTTCACHFMMHSPNYGKDSERSVLPTFHLDMCLATKNMYGPLKFVNYPEE